jgi:glycosyltransferase involved in cell wall biosynthesis
VENLEQPSVAVIVVLRERVTCTPRMLRELFSTIPATVKVILVDGGFPEAIRDELDQLAAARPFLHLKAERFLTPNEARNRALEHVGDVDYIAFMDNDIRVSPDWLEVVTRDASASGADWLVPLTVLRLRTADGVEDIVHHAGGDNRVVVQDGRLVWAAQHRGDGLRVDDPSIETFRGPCEQFEFHCIVGRASAVLALTPFDEPSDADDHYDLSIRAGLAGQKIHVTPNFRVAYDVSAPFHEVDFPFFFFRWGRRSIERGSSAFEARWGVDRHFLREYRGKHVARVLRSAHPDEFGSLDASAFWSRADRLEAEMAGDQRARMPGDAPRIGALPTRLERLRWVRQVILKSAPGLLPQDPPLDVSDEARLEFLLEQEIRTVAPAYSLPKRQSREGGETDAPLVTIAICTYRRAAGLRRLLETLRPRVEGLTDREILVVNDGSHDQSYDDVLRDHGAILRYVALPMNRGVANARNAAAQAARGDYIVYTDDDCEAPAWWIDWIVGRLLSSPELDVVIGTTRALPPPRPTFSSWVRREYDLIPTATILHGEPFLVTACAAIRRQCLMEHGGFLYPNEFRGAAEDTEIGIRLLNAGKRFLFDPHWYVWHETTEGLIKTARRYYRYGWSNGRLNALTSAPLAFSQDGASPRFKSWASFKWHFRQAWLSRRPSPIAGLAHVAGSTARAAIMTCYARGVFDAHRDKRASAAYRIPLLDKTVGTIR